MSKNLKTLICSILAVIFVFGTIVAVFADSTGAFKTNEAVSEVVSEDASEEETSKNVEDTTKKDPVTTTEDTSEEPPVVKYHLGDVNLDGIITAADARLALRTSAQLETLDAVQFVNADVVTDGKIQANDARLILRVSAKLESESVFGSADVVVPEE